jgi:hypothetical protein
MVDRKTLLVQADLERPKLPRDPKKLENEASEGLALKQMIETRGWKILLAEFIEKRNSIQRFLSTKTTKERDEAFGALTELNELLNFVSRHIKDGEDSWKELETIKRNGRN